MTTTEITPHALDFRKAAIASAILSCLFATAVQAQDTARRKTINITSVFKPALKDAAKINFNPGIPQADTTKPKLQYSLPSQYLFLTYLPPALNPVALINDSVKNWNNDNYIKVGIGNIQQPYLKAGFSFGDKKYSFFNVFADAYNSKGSLDYQKNSLVSVGINGTVKTKSNLEWDGKLGFRADGYYLYGYQPASLSYSKSDLQQQFQTYDLNIGLRNTVPSEFGLTYNPNLRVSVFSDNHDPKASEANSVLVLPLQKSLGEHFAFNLALTADLTNYRLNNESTLNNNLFYVSPALVYKSDNFTLHAEVTPSWDQKDFHLLPNFLADYTMNDKRITLFAAWTGYYEKGSYQRFESINPWLSQPTSLLNTRVQEFYGGLKGSLSNHVSYLARAGYAEYRNMPLFVNDSLDGKSFQIRYESKLDVFRAHGEITYTATEDFNATVALTLNNYTTKTEERAWGLLPLEFTTTLRWQIMKDLWLKGDLWAFEGAPYRSQGGQAYTGTGGFDLNAGIEFRITRQLNLWLQLNNLFNNKYQRWNQYPVYGFNILGGVIFSFGG
jgi:hypothetical protein